LQQTLFLFWFAPTRFIHLGIFASKSAINFNGFAGYSSHMSSISTRVIFGHVVLFSTLLGFAFSALASCTIIGSSSFAGTALQKQ
jgi:hypothetical protein